MSCYCVSGRFLPTYQQLQTMKLDKNAFVIISVIGQDLLACNYHAASVVVLESALRIGTCSLKLRGSVFSALCSAHWGLKNADQAIVYMQQDLSVAKSLGESDQSHRLGVWLENYSTLRPLQYHIFRTGSFAK